MISACLDTTQRREEDTRSLTSPRHTTGFRAHNKGVYMREKFRERNVKSGSHEGQTSGFQGRR